MTNLDLVAPVELTDAELDAVAAGAAAGLIAIDVGDINVVRNSQVLNNFANNNSVLNNNQVPIGVAVAVLGQAGAFALAGR